MKKRKKLTIEYINFLKNKIKVINFDAFFQYSHVEEFVCKHPDSYKSILLTHLSEILKAVNMQSQTNLQSLMSNPMFSLKQIPHFQKTFLQKKKPKILNDIAFEQVIKIYKCHDKYARKQYD